ncbi:MFS transporter [Actinoplanes regularis]|uniref:Major Facilitator Superfamily protein n=1 Tax=Actinoplanes regularis TaxID=52697 RepID=A0A239I5I8_9ACTN|nr:MFS transporter [Actinoplanes regularis]GIE91366.1 MFS transporter [Actinoplanes regularis]SNS88343.1 Major Facilitator Superfamily protein [Actinoplanes regularis]
MRVLLLATLVNAFGNGAYLTTSVLFLTTVAGLSPAMIAIGLSAGAVAGVLAMTPLGYVADRYGPKRLSLLSMIVLAGAYTALLAVHSILPFALLSCVIAVATALVKGANGALAAGAVPAADRLRVRAKLRSMINAGMGLGTLAGSLPLLIKTDSGYVVILLVNAASFLVAAALLTRAPAVPPQVTPAGGPRLVALRDRPFLAFAALDGLLSSTYNDLLGIGLPLWLATGAHAPLWLISVALVINTVGCVLLQVRMSRGVHGLAAARRSALRGAVVVALACAVFAATAGRSPWAAGTLIGVAAVVHVLGEVWLSTGSWGIVFELAPTWAQGQYQGTYFAGRGIGDMIAPPLVTACVLGLHSGGWLLLGALFVLGGLLYIPVTRWAAATRPAARPEPVRV